MQVGKSVAYKHRKSLNEFRPIVGVGSDFKIPNIERLLANAAQQVRRPESSKKKPGRKTVATGLMSGKTAEAGKPGHKLQSSLASSVVIENFPQDTGARSRHLLDAPSVMNKTHVATSKHALPKIEVGSMFEIQPQTSTEAKFGNRRQSQMHLTSQAQKLQINVQPKGPYNRAYVG